MKQSTPNGIDQLIDKATEHVAHEQQAAEAALAKQARASTTQQYLLGGLLVVSLGVAFVQVPKFSAPFESVDPTKSATVAEADLEIITSLVEAFRLSQGRYPQSLSEVTLPAALASASAKGTLIYANQGQYFTLDWTVPPWQLRYDGQSKQLTSKPAQAK